MKKLIISAAIAASFFAPAAAFADTSSTTPETISGGASDPMQVGMPWGLTGYQTPVFKAGQSVTDRGGIILSCPFFQGCFDTTKTAYYNTAMLSTAAQLKALGYTSSSVVSAWSGWLNLVN